MHTSIFVAWRPAIYCFYRHLAIGAPPTRSGDMAQDGDVVAHAAGQDEQVPDTVAVAQLVIGGIEGDAGRDR